MKARRSFPLWCTLPLLVSATACGQTGLRSTTRNAKNSVAVREAFTSSVRVVGSSVVAVRCGPRRVAFGTAVGRRQLVTKASQLTEGELRIETRDGGRYVARVIATDYDSDLALVSIDEDVLQPLRRSKGEVSVGDWLAIPGLDEVPIAVGVLSVKAHARRSRGRGHLAIEFEATRGSARVKRVPHGLIRGLAPGDVIERVGSREVSGPRSFARAIRRRRPGRNVTLTVRRGERLIELTTRVRSNRAPRNQQDRLWGPLSKVRHDFEEVIQHDLVISPSECGGPIVDLDGNFAGINIARAGRIETLALTPKVFDAALRRMRAKIRKKT